MTYDTRGPEGKLTLNVSHTEPGHGLWEITESWELTTAPDSDLLQLVYRTERWSFQALDSPPEEQAWIINPDELIRWARGRQSPDRP